MELARHNQVWFFSAPDETMGSGYELFTAEEMGGVKLVRYKIFLPEIFKFKLPALYKRTTEKKLKALVKKLVGKVDWCIDFGCYQFFDNLDFVNADRKIYFPVDDFGNLKLTSRGAEKIFSVSTSIVEKFRCSGLDCAFINHGLANVFAEKARMKLTGKKIKEHANGHLKFGYSGNLFIRFLDIPVLQKIIEGHPGVEFHFFGNTAYDPANPQHLKWFEFLSSTANVQLHGFLKPEKLAQAYEEMDGFLLCYKPDYKDYHAENSHKVFEYLSTGKLIISTHLSLYEGNELINMSPKDANHLLPGIFRQVIGRIHEYNAEEMQQRRLALALENTYQKQVERIVNSFNSFTGGLAVAEKQLT